MGTKKKNAFCETIEDSNEMIEVRCIYWMELSWGPVPAPVPAVNDTVCGEFLFSQGTQALGRHEGTGADEPLLK